MDVGCFAIHGFSEETGNYAIRGIAGIRHFTCRQAHPAPSPILLFNLRACPLFQLLLSMRVTVERLTPKRRAASC